MKKAVILLSGGLDSSTVLALAKSQGFEVYALSFNYGQKHDAELEAAKIIETVQFTEDLGPMSHPVRPDHFAEINNFSNFP